MVLLCWWLQGKKRKTWKNKHVAGWNWCLLAATNPSLSGGAAGCRRGWQPGAAGNQIGEYGMFQYILTCTRSYLYNCMVFTGIYWYISSQSVRKIRIISYTQKDVGEINIRCTPPIHGIQFDEEKFQNCSSLDTNKYILVHAGMYWNVLVQTSTKLHTSFHPALIAFLRLRPAPTSLSQTLGLLLLYI